MTNTEKLLQTTMNTLKYDIQMKMWNLIQVIMLMRDLNNKVKEWTNKLDNWNMNMIRK